MMKIGTEYGATKMLTRKIELSARDTERFHKKYLRGNNCWEWQELLDGKGYGILSANHNNFYAHRISAHLAGMDIDNKAVCHKCDNPKCVNPDHLWAGTLQQNNEDKLNKNRQAKGKDFGMRKSKLTQEDVDYIRDNYYQKNCRVSNAKQLASKFNVHTDTISNVIKGKGPWAIKQPQQTED